MGHSINGVLNIDKPAGMTSHDVVARVRRLAKIKRVGHAGTLDPDATGVLLVCLGAATRLADYLAAEGKAYRATLALGVTTTTEDASGEVIAEADAAHVTEASLRAVLPRFLGVVSQTPPMVSAVHHEGKRLYQLARQGIVVERQARTVQIDEIVVTDFLPGLRASAVLDVVCGKGTYIRTLCADIGAALGVGGHMAALRRTRSGAFAVEDAVPLDSLTESNLAAYLTSPAQALAAMPAYRVADAQEKAAIQNGRALLSRLVSETVKVMDAEDNLIALARADGEQLMPFAVLMTTTP